MESKIAFWKYGKTEMDWLAFRQRGIGGSDVGALCGEDPYKSRMELYLEKIGESPEKPVSEPMIFGKKLKNFIADEFSERMGLKTMRRNGILQHPSYPFMLANIDRVVIGEQVGLLCKAVSEFARDDWKNNSIPRRTELQCYHYMAVTGAAYWWIAVLIGGNKIKVLRLDRKEEEINHLIQIEKSFWEQHVEKRIPPAFDGSHASKDLLKRMYPSADENSYLSLPQEADTWISMYLEADQREKDATRCKTEAENNLKSMLGHHEFGKVGPYRIEWKNVVRKDASGYRRFKITLE